MKLKLFAWKCLYVFWGVGQVVLALVPTLIIIGIISPLLSTDFKKRFGFGVVAFILFAWIAIVKYIFRKVQPFLAVKSEVKLETESEENN